VSAYVRVFAKLVQDNTGAVSRIPVLLTPQGPMRPLVEYFRHYQMTRSLSWMDRVAQSAELLMQYVSANRSTFDSAEHLFQGFMTAVYHGTIGGDGHDPSGLYWRPRRTRNANMLIGSVADFSDWLAKKDLAQAVNPIDLQPQQHERVLAMAAYEHRRSRAFLGHVMPLTHEAPLQVRVTPTRQAPLVRQDDRPPAFPADFFIRLITEGMVRRGYRGHDSVLERMNARNVVITLLLEGAGLRISEVFHLWVHDVQLNPVDPSQALVRIYHPSEGAAPRDWHDADGKPAANRQDYLAMRYGRRPRHMVYGDSEWAGWKHPTLDDCKTMSMAVHWRSPAYGQLFLVLWQRYLRERALVAANHPWAFVTHKKGQRGGGQPGSPYTIASYVEAHRRAVERIGLVPAKANGTTPHGHRHAMGHYVAIDAELAPAAIMKILHHASLESQAVYTRPSTAEADRMLQQADRRLRGLPEPDLPKRAKPNAGEELAQLLLKEDRARADRASTHRRRK
jgi:integrase